MKWMLIATLFAFFLESLSYSQQAVVFVDVMNGSDTYSGANQTNDPAGKGPLASIDRALNQVADRGTIIILAGQYSGGDWHGGDIVVNSVTAPHVKSQLTFIAHQQAKNTCVDITSGSLIFDIDNLELNIEAASTTAYFNLAGKLMLGSKKNGVKVNLHKSSILRLKSKESLVLSGKSAFLKEKPEMGKK